MRALIVAVAIAVIGLTGAASAVTIIKTTQSDVKKHCNGKTSCMRDCGSTYCNYNCKKPKKQCTVAVYRQRPPTPTNPPLPVPDGRNVR
jgi:hypothetical protein